MSAAQKGRDLIGRVDRKYQDSASRQQDMPTSLGASLGYEVKRGTLFVDVVNVQ